MSLLDRTVSLRILARIALAATLLAGLASAAWWLMAPECGTSCVLMHQMPAIHRAQIEMTRLYRETGTLENLDRRMAAPRNPHILESHLGPGGVMVVGNHYARTTLIVEPVPRGKGELGWRCQLWYPGGMPEKWCELVTTPPKE